MASRVTKRKATEDPNDTDVFSAFTEETNVPAGDDEDMLLGGDDDLLDIDADIVASHAGASEQAPVHQSALQRELALYQADELTLEKADYEKVKNEKLNKHLKKEKKEKKVKKEKKEKKHKRDKHSKRARHHSSDEEEDESESDANPRSRYDDDSTDDDISAPLSRRRGNLTSYSDDEDAPRRARAVASRVDPEEGWYTDAAEQAAKPDDLGLVQLRRALAGKLLPEAYFEEYTTGLLARLANNNAYMCVRIEGLHRDDSLPEYEFQWVDGQGTSQTIRTKVYLHARFGSHSSKLKLMSLSTKSITQPEWQAFVSAELAANNPVLTPLGARKLHARQEKLRREFVYTGDVVERQIEERRNRQQLVEDSFYRRTTLLSERESLDSEDPRVAAIDEELAALQAEEEQLMQTRKAAQAQTCSVNTLDLNERARKLNKNRFNMAQDIHHGGTVSTTRAAYQSLSPVALAAYLADVCGKQPTLAPEPAADPLMRGTVAASEPWEAYLPARATALAPSDEMDKGRGSIRADIDWFSLGGAPITEFVEAAKADRVAARNADLQPRMPAHVDRSRWSELVPMSLERYEMLLADDAE